MINFSSYPLIAIKSLLQLSIYLTSISGGHDACDPGIRNEVVPEQDECGI